MSAEVDALLTALRAEGDRIVDRLLLENAGRWRSLQPADRLRVERLARDVVERLLEEPARRMERAPATHARAVSHLFALDQSRSDPSRRRTRVSI
jgi:glutamyl-tRNA reductase